MEEDQEEDQLKTFSNANATYEWTQNKQGQLHSLNGPAYKQLNGYEEWWLRGGRYDLDQLDKWPLGIYLEYLKSRKSEDHKINYIDLPIYIRSLYSI